jgi:very-short-patch-repair endonuclease
MYSNRFSISHRLKFSDIFLELLNKLPESILNFISTRIEERLFNLFRIIEDCESPIEQLLIIALYDLLDDYPDVYMVCQEKIKLKNAIYRVDVCLYIGDWLNAPDKCKKLVIECDGYTFHEKTKEQAMREKKRDRSLIEAGYLVLHFTGREIFIDPYQCAREIKKLVDKLRTSNVD